MEMYWSYIVVKGGEGGGSEVRFMSTTIYNSSGARLVFMMYKQFSGIEDYIRIKEER